jgi:hypothetical protein
MATLPVKLKVHSLSHLDHLIDERHTDFMLEAVVQPSGETRTSYIYVDRPKRVLAANDDAVIYDNFGYNACLLVLANPGKYEASIYCLGNWSAHDIAQETARWGL